MEKTNDLEILKRRYKEIQEKYSLPSFEDLNKDFGIEKASEIETSLLIREIRKYISEKLSNYLRFVEAILNPVNVQMFVYSFIKSLGVLERGKLSEIYEKLSRHELKLIELDLEYSEQKEAEYINSTFQMWAEVKKDLLDIIEKADKNWNTDSKTKTNNYFG